MASTISLSGRLDLVAALDQNRQANACFPLGYLKRLTQLAKAPVTDASILARAEALDVLDAILPFRRRDQLAELLTDDDVAALTSLAIDGMADNTLRALASDLGYLEAWCTALTGAALPWPAPHGLIVTFIAQHLCDLNAQQAGTGNGMPSDVEAFLRRRGLLRAGGPHAPSTVKRRLASWSMLTKRRGMDGAFTDAAVREALRPHLRNHQTAAMQKPQSIITTDVLARLLATCASDRLTDLRDSALLQTAFAAGGRRRSELASLRIEDLVDGKPVHDDPSDPGSPLRPTLSVRLRRNGRTAGDDAAVALMSGPPVLALKRWLAAAGIASGPVFRKIDQWGNVDRRPISPQAVNLIVKSRCEKAGLDPDAFSAHSLRAGYRAEAADGGMRERRAKRQSRH